MANCFYSEFDLERLPDSGPSAADDYRTAFQVERDRILFSYAFRRLQAKTQVFQTGVYDYYRTRLTHSLEVGRVACSLVDWLHQAEGSPLSLECSIDTDLVEAIGFAHDLGHPPFGHAGERKLNELMCAHGGFEGNAQTVRMLTQLIYREGRSGMNPTRALLDGIMKYKNLRSEGGEDARFLYDSQSVVRDFTLNGAYAAGGENRYWQSIEGQIVDWADDITYSLHDILDAVQTGFIGYRLLREWAEQNELNNEESEHLEYLINCLDDGSVEARFSKKIALFVRSTRLEEQEHPLAELSNRYRYSLYVDPAVRDESRFYKRMAESLIFDSTVLQRLEYKGGHVLGRLFEALYPHYAEMGGAQLNLLPIDAGELIRAETDVSSRARRLCDWLAGLTDHAACKLHSSLFDPDKSFGV